MAVYLITGKLGTGKTKSMVERMRLALRKGRRVATNIDLDLRALCGPRSRTTYIRLPDKPTATALAALPPGNESYDEERNGLLVLDELGSWLNTRTFQDRDRGPTLDWLIHSRKRGWDCYFICQDFNQVDKQFRESIVEFVGRCSRLDRLYWPVVGRPINGLLGGRAGRLPRLHVCAIRMGSNPAGVVAERFMYQGDELHAAYDTRQIFRDDYPHGPHTVLSPWHQGGHALPPSSTWSTRLREFFAAPPTKPQRRRPRNRRYSPDRDPPTRPHQGAATTVSAPAPRPGPTPGLTTPRLAGPSAPDGFPATRTMRPPPSPVLMSVLRAMPPEQRWRATRALVLTGRL